MHPSHLSHPLVLYCAVGMGSIELLHNVDLSPSFLIGLEMNSQEESLFPWPNKKALFVMRKYVFVNYA